MSRYHWVAVLLLWASSTLLAAPTLTWAQGGARLPGAQITRLGRPATALVVAGEAPNSKEGSAFCVHPSGLFVTNHHVVGNIIVRPVQGPDGRFVDRDPPIKLVLNGGREDQKVVSARVLWSDPKWDLALLSADGVSDLPSLRLATDAGLSGLSHVVAFGFPLGSVMAAKGEAYPSVNVSQGKVLAIKRVEGEPTDIEADISINSGNSGGPLLDGQGRVVGVIYARRENPVDHAGVSLAVPVNRLELFLSRPEITFEPPLVFRADRDKPVEFKAALRSLFPPRDPLTIELVLGGTGEGARRYPMRLVDGAYRTKAVPFGGAKDSRAVQLEMTYMTNRARRNIFWVEDTLLEADGKPLRLSEVQRMSMGPLPQAWIKSGEGVARKGTGPDAHRPAPLAGRVTESARPRKVTGLDGLLAAIESQDVDFDPASHTMIRVGDTSDPDTVLCTVVARRSGRTVSSRAVPLFLSDAERADLKAVSQGRFFRPRRSASPVTSFRYHIPAGDPALKQGNPLIAKNQRTFLSTRPGDPPGLGETYQKGPDNTGVQSASDITFSGEIVRGGIMIIEIGPARLTLIFKAQKGKRIEAGEYVVKPYDPDGRDNSWAYVRVGPMIPSNPKTEAPYTGRFMVWEIEQAGGKGLVSRLAVDFVLYRKSDRPGGGDAPSVSGMLRIHSHFE
jgi:hypothetical protein